MTATLGYVTKLDNGNYVGGLDLRPPPRRHPRRPVASKRGPARADYRVTHRGVEIGGGGNDAGREGEPHASPDRARPGLGPNAFRVHPGRAPDQDDDNVYAMIWNVG